MAACESSFDQEINKVTDDIRGVGPLYGKLSDIIGRKPILFASIVTFLFGSALCGAAQNFIWLAVCRGVQGIGAGGIMQMVLITISDISMKFSLIELVRYLHLSKLR